MSGQQVRNLKRRAHMRGRLAEIYAATYLRLKGYNVVARHYRKPFGEIDIIACKGRTLNAVEVKTRQTMTDALYSIGPVQKKRVRRAMEAFVMEKSNFQSFNIRFDALLVTSFLRLPNHIENAWE